MSRTTISVLHSAAWFPGMPGSGVSYIIKQGMHCEGLNSLTDERSHNICNPVCGSPGKAAPGKRRHYPGTLTVICKCMCTCIHTGVHMHLQSRCWSLTALSRNLNVEHARMGLKDEDNPDELSYWWRSLIFLEWKNNWTGHKCGCIHLYIYSSTDSSEFLSFQARAANFQELQSHSCFRKLHI